MTQKNVKIISPLKYLSNFWRTLETPLVNCRISLILTWAKNCIISNCAANQEAKYAITDIKLYVPVVTLSNQDNVKLLQQLKSGFKKTINWNKFQSKTSTQAPKRYLDSSFQRVSRLLVITNANRAGHTKYYLKTI